MTKRIVALFLVLVTLFSLVPSASAAESSVSVWDWIKALSPAAAAGSALYDVVVGSGNEDVTPVDRYDQYVSTLPSNGYSSDGSLLYRPPVLYIYGQDYYDKYHCSIRSWGDMSSVDTSGVTVADATLDVSASEVPKEIYFEPSAYDEYGIGLNIAFVQAAPVSGEYSCMELGSRTFSWAMGDGTTDLKTASWSSSCPMGHFSGGDDLLGTTHYHSFKQLNASYLRCTIRAPLFKIVPDTSGDSAPDYTTIYNNTTRMGNIGGNYGTVNNDNSVTQYTTQYIVNEGDKIYTNPVTGQSRPIVDWSYDYDDRSYSLNFEGGDTTTVTYGDEKVSINETTIDGNGNTVTNKYEVNYIVNSGGGSDDPSPSPSPSPPVPSTNPGGGSGGFGSGSGSGSVNPLSRVFANYAATITQAYGTDGHGGTDCVPTSGVVDTVTAHSEGDVVWVQTGQSNNQGTSGDLSYGNAVKIKHSNSYYTLYAHLATVEVSQGQHVYKGQALGQMGDTGNSYGAHLHFEVRDSTDARINSDPYLNADLPGLEGGGKTEDDRSIWDKLGDLIGTGVDGLLSLVEAVVSKVLDGLISLLEMLTSKLTAVVETVLSVFDQLPALFGGFLDLLGLLFPYLPEEITLLLTFGIIAVVAIWIIKAFKGR